MSMRTWARFSLRTPLVLLSICALLLLPAILATMYARSMKGVFVLAAVIGLISSCTGFFVSVALDIPVSSGVTIIAAVLLAAGALYKRLKKVG